MTREPTESTLPPSVELALAHPEFEEPSDAEFEELARSIERRIANVTPGRGEDGDWLFRAPLPLGNGERVLEADARGHVASPARAPAESTAKASPSDHLSLKEIAEAAMREERAAHPPPDTGVAPPHRSPARSGIHLIAIADSATAPSPSMQPRPAARGPLNVAKQPAPRRLDRLALWVSGTLALAAGLAVWFTSAPQQQPGPVAITTLVVPVQATNGAPESERPAAPAERRERAALGDPSTPSVAAIDPATLPTEPERVAARPPARPRSATPAPAEPTPEAASPPAEPGVAEPRLVPAAELGAKPSRPSVGAAQAAVGSTLGAARLCIVGQLAPSYATVVFGSDGRVRNVRVSGPAAGTPAEPCIQRAMQGSRLQPFAEETFSVKTTVRP